MVMLRGLGLSEIEIWCHPSKSWPIQMRNADCRMRNRIKAKELLSMLKIGGQQSFAPSEVAVTSLLNFMRLQG